MGAFDHIMDHTNQELPVTKEVVVGLQTKNDELLGQLVENSLALKAKDVEVEKLRNKCAKVQIKLWAIKDECEKQGVPCDKIATTTSNALNELVDELPPDYLLPHYGKKYSKLKIFILNLFNRGSK